MLWPHSIALTAAALLSMIMGSASAPVAPQETRIVGGKAIGGCGWPSVVSLSGCTGTLIHPQVVLTAAHCAPHLALPLVRISPKTGKGPMGLAAVKKCVSNPGFHGNFGDGQDWAYCILHKPVRDIPIVPVMTECERAEWTRYAMHDSTVMVGFGLDEFGNSGAKRQVKVPVKELLGDEIRVGGEGQAGCHGDSGGPAFVQLPDKSWRVMGIISYARGKCGNPEYLAAVPAALSWLNAELAKEGIDVTPCTDAQGVWVGGPYCADFPLNPQSEHCGTLPLLGGKTQSCTSSFGDRKIGTNIEDSPALAPKHKSTQPQVAGNTTPEAPPAAVPASQEQNTEPEDFSLGCQLHKPLAPGALTSLGLGLLLFRIRR